MVLVVVCSLVSQITVIRMKITTDQTDLVSLLMVIPIMTMMMEMGMETGWTRRSTIVGSSMEIQGAFLSTQIHLKSTDSLTNKWMKCCRSSGTVSDLVDLVA